LKLFSASAKDCGMGGNNFSPRLKSGKMLHWRRLAPGFCESLLRSPSNMQSGRLVNNIIMAEISGHINIIGQRAQEWWWDGSSDAVLMPGCLNASGSGSWTTSFSFAPRIFPTPHFSPAFHSRQPKQKQQRRTTGFAIVWRWWNKQRDVSSAGEMNRGVAAWGVNGGSNKRQCTTVWTRKVFAYHALLPSALTSWQWQKMMD